MGLLCPGGKRFAAAVGFGQGQQTAAPYAMKRSTPGASGLFQAAERCRYGLHRFGGGGSVFPDFLTMSQNQAARADRADDPCPIQ